MTPQAPLGAGGAGRGTVSRAAWRHMTHSAGGGGGGRAAASRLGIRQDGLGLASPYCMD